MFPGGQHILDISELTYKNLHDKSVFDYLNKKQTIDDWSNKSHSIAIFVAEYRDLLYQMPFWGLKTLLIMIKKMRLIFIMMLIMWVTTVVITMMRIKRHSIRSKLLGIKTFGDRFPKIPIPQAKLIMCLNAPHNF